MNLVWRCYVGAQYLEPMLCPLAEFGELGELGELTVPEPAEGGRAQDSPIFHADAKRSFAGAGERVGLFLFLPFGNAFDKLSTAAQGPIVYSAEEFGEFGRIFMPSGDGSRQIVHAHTRWRYSI